MNGKRQCYCKRQLSFVTKSSVFNFRFVVRDICERSSSTRIKIDYIWDPMKLAKYKTMSTWMKKTKVRVGDKVIKLREERQILARLMMIQQTRKLDVGTVIGMYEMTVIPRSSFSNDGLLMNYNYIDDLYKWMIFGTSMMAFMSSLFVEVGILSL